MSKTSRRILKAGEVALAAPLCLSLDPVAGPHGADAPCAAGAASVRIAENHPDGAVIEVTCTCGRTTYIRCNYGAANPSPAGQIPT
jgi:hypothetical protein